MSKGKKVKKSETEAPLTFSLFHLSTFATISSPVKQEPPVLPLALQARPQPEPQVSLLQERQPGPQVLKHQPDEHH